MRLEVHDIFSFQEISLGSEGESDGKNGCGGRHESVSTQEHHVGHESLYGNRRVGVDGVIGVCITKWAVRVDHLGVSLGGTESVLNLSVGVPVSFVRGQKQEGGKSVSLIGSLKEDFSFDVSKVARNRHAIAEINRGSSEVLLGNPVPATVPDRLRLEVRASPTESTITPGGEKSETVRVVTLTRNS